MSGSSKPASIHQEKQPNDTWRSIVLENALDAVIGIDSHELIIEWNHQAEVTFGWTKHQALGQIMADLIIPIEDREAHKRGVQHFLRTGEGPILSRRIEVRGLHRAGHTFPAELTIIPIQMDGSYFFYSFIRDITDRYQHELFLKGAEQALRSSESLFRALFELTPFATQVLAPDGRTLQVNTAWKQLWEPPEETVANYILKDYNILNDPQLKKKGILPYLERAFQGESTQAPQVWYDPNEVGKPGRARWVKAYVRPVKSSLGELQYVVLIQEDVTEQVLAAEKQKFLSEFFFQLTRLTQTEELIAYAVEATAHHLGVTRCWLSEVDDSRATATVYQDFALGVPSLKGTYKLEAFGIKILESWRLGGVIHVDDVKSDLRTSFDSKSHLKLDIRSFVSIPLHRNGQLVAAFNISMDKPRAWTHQEKDLTRSVAETLWSAIEKARLYQEAKEAIQTRDEFISICSHELRTPVTSMKLEFQVTARQISMGDTSALSPEFIEKRVANANIQLDRMANLIEEMLDVSRISIGKLQMKMEFLDLHDLVGSVLERFAGQFTFTGVTVNFDSKPLGSRWHVFGDRYRLEQVVSNLLTNTLKYGSGKPIQVSVEAVTDKIQLRVKDQGIGIAKENLERIFNRFERAISYSNISGLGLGLYLSRQIVEMHRGRIWAESELGKGSTFIVELPISQ